MPGERVRRIPPRDPHAGQSQRGRKGSERDPPVTPNPHLQILPHGLLLAASPLYSRAVRGARLSSARARLRDRLVGLRRRDQIRRSIGARHRVDDRHQRKRHDEVAQYAAAVERLSGGSIRLVPQESWRSGDPDPGRGTIADVRASRTDLAKVDVRSYGRLGVHGFDAVIAPFLVDRLTLEEKLLASPLPRRMLPTLAQLGVVGIAMLPGPLEHPFGLERRLLSPSDYRGAVIGTTPTTLARLSLAALHAVPRAYRPGRASPVAVFGRRARPRQPRGRRALSRLREVFGHRERRFLARSLDDHREPRGSGEVGGGNRRLLADAARESLPAAVAQLRAEDRSEAQTLCRRDRVAFVQASPSDVSALRAAVRPVYARLDRDPLTRSLIQRIQAMKRDAPLDPQPRCTMPTQRTRFRLRSTARGR